MKQNLLERKYRARRQPSTLPLTYGAAFQAFSRRKAGVCVAGDFAQGMVFRADMTFEAFLLVNAVELIEDREETKQ